jgi:hypothetical protein
MTSVLDRIAARIGHEPDAAEPAEGSMGLGPILDCFVSFLFLISYLLLSLALGSRVSRQDEPVARETSGPPETTNEPSP